AELSVLGISFYAGTNKTLMLNMHCELHTTSSVYAPQGERDPGCPRPHHRHTPTHTHTHTLISMLAKLQKTVKAEQIRKGGFPHEDDAVQGTERGHNNSLKRSAQT